MKRIAVLGIVAGCASPAASTLTPRINVGPQALTRLAVSVQLDRAAEVDMEARFRGSRSALVHGDDNQSYFTFFDLPTPLADGEPVDVTIDSITMTLEAPRPFDGLDVPPFLPRSQPSTIRWTATSSDAGIWDASSSACVNGYGLIAPNAAMVTFEPADWTYMDSVPDRTCTASIYLTRARQIAIDPAFAGGSATFIQTAQVVSASSP